MLINIAHAAIVTCTDPDKCDWKELVATVARLINYLIILAGLLAGWSIGFAGFTMILAHGSAEQVTKARQSFNKAIIGLIWILGAWLIVRGILIAFGLQQGFSIIPLR